MNKSQKTIDIKIQQHIIASFIRFKNLPIGWSQSESLAC